MNEYMGWKIVKKCYKIGAVPGFEGSMGTDLGQGRYFDAI